MKAIWGCSQKVGDYFSLGRVNDSLALENHNLRARLAEMEFAMAEAGLASPDMNIDKVKGFSYTPAHIVKISNGTQHNYLIVDKGAAYRRLRPKVRNRTYRAGEVGGRRGCRSRNCKYHGEDGMRFGG